MARKKRNRSGQRDVSLVASPPAARPNLVRPAPLVSDRRLYHPDGYKAPVYAPVRTYKRIVEHVVQRPRHSVVRKKNAVWARPTRFAFQVPKKVELCVRREKRRQVLFAMRRTGKGSRARRRRRNYWTGVSCK